MMGEKIERQGGKYKIWIIAILLAGVCVLTYYFHVVLGTGTVFTHFFYIPIILASLWWKRKGLIVAIFSSAFLIFSHIFLRPEITTANDYFRALMFIVIALVVAELSRRITKEEEKVLRENEERLRLILEHSTDGISIAEFDVKTHKRRLILCNDRYVEMSGRSKEELMKADNLNEFIQDHSYPQELQKLLQGFACQGLTSWIRPDDKENYYEWTATPIKRGDKFYIVGIDRDITERKRAEESLRLFSQAADSSINGIAMGNPEGKITYVNETFVRMFGYSREELIGKEVAFIYPEEQIPKLEEALKATMEGGWTGELIAKRKDGEVFPVMISSSRVLDDEGKVIAHMASHQDITERKQAEQEILASREKLRHLTSELCIAEEHERRRLAAGVHDNISQNLALAKLTLQSSKDSADSNMSALLDKVCAVIDKTIQDAHSLTFELSNPVLHELGFEAAVEQWLTEQIQEKYGIKCKFAADTQPLEIDNEISIILFQAVRELLVNVVKHAKANTVGVRIQKAGDEIQIAVKDDGIGFLPYEVQLSSSQNKMGGFGLFSIRERLECLGGDMKVESAPGQGTSVYLTAPTKTVKATL